jgi:hypothetical protein
MTEGKNYGTIMIVGPKADGTYALRFDRLFVFLDNAVVRVSQMTWAPTFIQGWIESWLIWALLARWRNGALDRLRDLLLTHD